MYGDLCGEFVCGYQTSRVKYFVFQNSQIEGLDDLEDEIEEVIPKLEKKWSRTLLHTVAFY